MKNKWSVVLVMILGLFAIACSKAETKDIDSQNTSPTDVKVVKVMEVSVKERPVELDYAGFVEADNFRTYSFKSNGIIEAIFIKEGQQVKAGDQLCKLDEVDIAANFNKVKALYEAASSAYEKAADGGLKNEYDQAKRNLELVEKSYLTEKTKMDGLRQLYSAGAISKNEYEVAEVQFMNSENVYLTAKETEVFLRTNLGRNLKLLESQVIVAESNYEQAKERMENTVLIAKEDGVVAKILVEKDQAIMVGQSIIQTCDASRIVKAGVTREDFSKIAIGMPSRIQVSDDTYMGTVSSIASLPDAQTGTYEIEIQLNSNELVIGSTAQVAIELNSESGFYIPIRAIMNDGTDFVFVEKDGRVIRKEIRVEKVLGSDVKVTGLEAGEKLITDGVKSIEEGDFVQVL